MSHGEIRAIDRACRLYRPGHQVHWIQAKKSVEEQQPVIDVAVVVHDDGRIDIQGDDLNLTAWNHDPDRLQSAVDYWGRAVWKPRYHVLSLPGLFGFIFNMATLDMRTECWPGPRDRSMARYEQRKLSNPEAEVAVAVARRDHGPIPVCGRRPANGHEVVHELLLTRSEPGIGVSVTDRAAGYLRCC